MEEDELMKKMENQVNKKSGSPKKKNKPKKKEDSYHLYKKLMVENLVKLGYIKNN